MPICGILRLTGSVVTSADVWARRQTEGENVMNLLRGASAILTFVVALLTLALGLYGLVGAWAFAAQTRQPIDPWWLTGGLLACVVGVLCLIASRAIDPEHGPVRSYRKRPRKSQTRA